VHDYFDILGVSDGAPPQQIRRASARRAGQSHPDFQFEEDDRAPAGLPRLQDALPAAAVDAAVDFAEMTSIVERMRADFFSSST
jgi:hypothetical protein